MEWNVKNAVNRDVERQHLNKILKEIQGSYDSISSQVNSNAQDINATNTIITRVINSQLTPAQLATQVTLTGDVTGVSTPVPGQNAVTITTTLQGNYVTEAPIDAQAYWRFQGAWQAVPSAVQNLTTLNGTGYVVIDGNGFWRNRNLLTADPSRIVITDGSGSVGDTTFDLATVTPAAVGTLQLTRFDTYGRRDGEAPATTDNLAEGTTNLYWKEAPLDGQLYGRQNATWQPVISGGFVPYFIPDMQIFTVPVYQQALYSQEIILDGLAMIVLEGILIEVD